MEFTAEHAKVLKETNKTVIQHDVKLGVICKSITKIEEGIKEILQETKNNTVGCVENRFECRKDIDKELDDLKDKVDEKISKKVDWKYFGGVVTLISIVIAILNLV